MNRVLSGLTLLFALIACAWFALGIRQAHDTSRATALLLPGKPLHGDQAAHARSLLGSAASLNPDLTVDLLRGRLAIDERRYVVAEATFRSVARREPMNLEAWSQLAFAAAAARDRATLVEAARHISELYPKLR